MTTLADELKQLNKHREDLERRIKEEELQKKEDNVINLKVKKKFKRKTTRKKIFHKKAK